MERRFAFVSAVPHSCSVTRQATSSTRCGIRPRSAPSVALNIRIVQNGPVQRLANVPVRFRGERR